MSGDELQAADVRMHWKVLSRRKPGKQLKQLNASVPKHEAQLVWQSTQTPETITSPDVHLETHLFPGAYKAVGRQAEQVT